MKIEEEVELLYKSKEYDEGNSNLSEWFKCHLCVKEFS